MNTIECIECIECIDCIEGIRELRDNSIQLVVTSPPFAEQRKGLYNSIKEEDYPTFTISWIREIVPKLKEDGCICIELDKPINNGKMSLYVLKTILSIVENTRLNLLEEIVEINNAPTPNGGMKYPRRAFRSVFVFSKLPIDKVKINIKKAGRMSEYAIVTDKNVIGRERLNKARKEMGKVRAKNVIETAFSKVTPNLQHPAKMPVDVPNYLIRLFSDEKDIVCDPFCGSGTVLRESKRLNRQYIGFDISREYVQMATDSLIEIERGEGL